MQTSYVQALNSLTNSGWRVELPDRPRPVPPHVARRYSWLPEACTELLSETKAVISPTATAWLNNFEGGAFAWNEWELICLKAAGSDAAWRARIGAFWDNHFPLFMSVKSGYAYFAIERTSLQIVRGEEPEFEYTNWVSGTALSLLDLFTSSPSLARWI